MFGTRVRGESSCGRGFYKWSSQALQCSRCPAHSSSDREGSWTCPCEHGFHRAPADPPSMACTRPPSAPQDLGYTVNQTTVTLDWSPPADTGGRRDITYRVACQRCGGGAEECSPCGGGVTFDPRQAGLLDPSVTVLDLLPNTNYTFEVEAVSGVSDLSWAQRLFAAVSVATMQAGCSAAPQLGALCGHGQWEDTGAREQDVSVTSAPDEHYIAESRLQKQPRTAHIGILFMEHDMSDRKPPSQVSEVVRESVQERSVQLSWQEPQHPNGVITQYEIKYYEKDQRDGFYSTVKSQSPLATVHDLKPSTAYVFQIRAVTAAGFGSYGPSLEVTTQDEATAAAISGEQNPVIIIAVVAVAGTIILVFMVFKPSSEKFARELDASCIKIERVIGAGEFGEVCSGCLRLPGKRDTPVAIKTLKVGHTEKQRRDFLSEASVMGQFEDPNVLHLEGVVTRGKPVMVVLEYMENGALDSFLRKNDSQFTVIQLVGMLRGVAAGMRYLSDMGYVHRDLAARNVLVNSNLVCKVSDFKLSRPDRRRSRRRLRNNSE
ncbi:hypothetical protein AAFF_G00261190 [Aldrovandia affinis]|uniref:receptor protein-tyrosine kinase n=1 Tax=Aldrovandia affinis TaxID=143900 RepID=A0AAD7RBT5_9TELE|nr:hypothetical protein AAFF_G00261190 [Aldrovandia affinis]